MKRLFCYLLSCILGLTFMPPLVVAQPAPNAAVFSQPELDQLLAPIALYPDPLLSQVLVAATYPLETVQAARFVKENPALKGDALAQAVQAQTWDPSVKALAQFPSVLTMMDDQLAWTQKLGDAFLAQQDAVMDTVQALRAKAQAAGTLKSNQQQNVVAQDGAIDIDPYAPDTVYVPYYNPTVVYGNWWWPGWQPFVWVPPLEYQSPYFGNMYAGGIAFGFGIGIADALFFPIYPDWAGHHFINGNWPGHRPNGPGRPWRPGGTVWTHNPAHRLGVAYRDATSRQRFQPNATRNVNSDVYRGHVTNMPQGEQTIRNDAIRQSEARPAAPPAFSARPPGEQAHPFMPAGSASTMQSHSDRGRASRAGSGPVSSGGSHGQSRR